MEAQSSRKEDRSENEPDTLWVMLASLDRHFKENGAPYSLLKDKAFVCSRQVLNRKAIELHESGRGKRIHGWIVSKDGKNTRELQEHYKYNGYKSQKSFPNENQRM